MSDLTKDECTEENGMEWVPGHIACTSGCGQISDANLKKLKRAYDRTDRWRQAAKNTDEIDLENETIDTIDLTRRRGFCRTSRNRAATQPSSYDTGSSSTTEFDGFEDDGSESLADLFE